MPLAITTIESDMAQANTADARRTSDDWINRSELHRSTASAVEGGYVESQVRLTTIKAGLQQVTKRRRHSPLRGWATTDLHSD